MSAIEKLNEVCGLARFGELGDILLNIINAIVELTATIKKQDARIERFVKYHNNLDQYVMKYLPEGKRPDAPVFSQPEAAKPANEWPKLWFDDDYDVYRSGDLRVGSVAATGLDERKYFVEMVRCYNAAHAAYQAGKK